MTRLRAGRLRAHAASSAGPFDGHICISRFGDCKLVEEWEVWDALGALRQAGGLPEPVGT